ncbi:hypothetical protein [Kaarinaea lacus]
MMIDFIQEGTAETALDAIRNMLSHYAMEKRDGNFISFPAKDGFDESHAFSDNTTIRFMLQSVVRKK